MVVGCIGSVRDCQTNGSKTSVRRIIHAKNAKNISLMIKLILKTNNKKKLHINTCSINGIKMQRKKKSHFKTKSRSQEERSEGLEGVFNTAGSVS